MFFLNRFPECFNLFVLLFLVTPCLAWLFSLAWSESQLKKKKWKCKFSICLLPVLQKSFLCMFILKFNCIEIFQHNVIFSKVTFHQINYAAAFTSKHFPLLSFFTFKIFVLSKTLLPSIMSLRFLFLLNAKIEGSAKTSFNFGSICKICQFLSIFVFRSGRVLLYITGSGNRSVLDALILFSKSFLGVKIVQLIGVIVSVLL